MPCRATSYLGRAWRVARKHLASQHCHCNSGSNNEGEGEKLTQHAVGYVLCIAGEVGMSVGMMMHTFCTRSLIGLHIVVVVERSTQQHGHEDHE